MTNFYFNLNQKLQGCSKQKGMVVYSSNSDGQPTVKRQSRLMSNPGEMNKKEQMSSTCPRFALVLPSFCSRLDSLSLVSRQSDLDQVRAVSAGLSARVWKHVAMIFAVLVMSIANIGSAWGVDYSSTPLVSLDFSSSLPTVSGVTYNAASYSSGKISWSGNYSKGSRDVQIAFTTTGGHFKLVIGHVTSGSSMTFKYTLDSGSAQNLTFNKSATSDTYEITASAGSHTISLGPGGSSTRTVVTSIAIYDEAPSCTNPTASWSTAPANGTAGGNMNASLTTNYAAGVVYTSSNTDVATVSGNGTTTCAITYVAAGTARITATVTGDGSTICAGPATCYTDITVSAPEPSCGETAQAALTLSSNSGTICGTGSTTFTVSGGSGSGALSVSSSDETKATASIDGSTVTVTGVAAGSATITVTKACDATYAEKTATYSATVAAIPTANAGVDKTTEPGNGVALAATAAASGCTGAWTIQSGPNTSTAQLSSTTSATATFTPTVAGTYTLRWTVTNTSSSCSAYDEMAVSAAVCSISECGNATLTYVINGGSSGDHSEGGADLISSATASNTTALGASTTVGYTGISMSSLAKKAAAAISACYPTKPNMSGKIGVYNGAAYNSSNYLQFAFTVKTGYTFTPCDIEFTVQPVDVATNFRWEVTDGTNVYGYGTATDVPKGSDGGASVLTGLTSTAEMAAGTYYIRLYPYVNAASKTFRISNNVILKGTTAAVASDAYDIHIGKDNDNYTDESLTNTSGTTWSKTITLDGGSYYEFKVKKTSSGSETWYGNDGRITATTSPAWDFSSGVGTNCKLYTTVAGSYTFSWDTSNDKLTITYPAGSHPTKRIYMACGSTWCNDSPKFFVHSWGVSEYNTQVQESTCDGYYADIIWYNDYFQFTRNSSAATAYNNNQWNVSQDLTYNSSQPKWTCTGWSDGKGTFSSSAYSPTTYTISYATGSTTATGGAAISGSKANETKTCGVDFTLPSSAVFTATGYTQVGWTTTDGGTQTHALGGSYTGNAAQTFYPVWEAAAATCTGDPTVLVSGTLYQVSDMASACLGELTSTGQYFYGLSSNGKFYINGTTNSNNASTGTVEIKTASNTIDKINFTGIAWFKGTGTTTCRSIKFVVPSAGTLTIYGKTSSGNGNVVIKTESSGNTTVIANSVNAYASGSTTVSAGTYYVLSDGGSAAIVGLKFVESACSTPTAPTGFTAGSITSTGATFSITDGGDAASYDIYYSTSSSAPAASAAATTTSDSKTKVVTGLTANTTYYAWVRSVCDASHKSAWVALSGSSFTTSAAAASQTALVINTLYEVPDMIPSGATLTNDDQFFEGLSANTKFELIGSASSSTTPKANSNSTNDKTIDGITFDDGSMWFKGTASLTSNIPTTYGLSFIVPSAGKLYLYFSGTSTNIKLAKSGETGSKPSCPNGYGAVDVTAGTYYLYGTGTTAPYCFYGLKLCSTYSVSITTNNTTKTSGETGSTAAVNGKAYTATFTANTGYTLPSDVTVSIGGVAQTKGTGYTWTVSSGTGTLTVPAAKVTGNIVVTVTGTAAATYALTYNCNGAESGCPSNTTASALPNPLPSAPTKDGYTFGGWYTDAELTVPAVAGATMTGATTLYAKWTVNSSSECITITHWGTTNATTEAWAGSIADENKYKLVQSGSGTTNNKSTDSNASICLYYATTMSIYDSPTTTTDFANVTSVSFKVKLYNAAKKPTITVSVGSDSGETVTLSENTDNSTFKTYTVNFGTQLTGAVKFKNNGSGDSGYKVYLDDIEICTASMSSCTTPTLPTATLSNQSLCEGADIAAWDATPTNASTITAAGQSISYSWKKKGSSTELANTATFDLGSSAAESQAGTYIVTVTVSKAGYASATATKEVTLTVNEATEVTAITADKATVYPTNSVTLTATANMDATWQWYTCTNAEGDGEVIISGATSASYTIASAGAAGTYYYKAEATGSCGIGSMVYTLTVSAAAGGDCETEFWFAYDSDRPEGAAAATHITTALTAGSTASASITIDGNTYAITKRSSNSTGPVTIVIPEGNTGTVYVLINGSSSRSLTLTKGGVSQWSEVPVGWTSYSITGLDEGTYTLSGSGNLGWGLVALKLCSAVACTDPEVTASVNNSTACVGTSVTFTATGAHASATYQWQKYSGGAWTDIAGAKAATYNIASVATTDALKYRVIATNECDRTSNEVTLSVPSAPNFGSTVPASVSVMQTIALSINTVEATDAVKYRWYKSADATWDAGDTEIGTNKELIKAYDSEAIGSPSYYIFCRAQNACGITTSTAIAVNVTAYVEEDCATKGNEGEAQFGFENTGCSNGSIESTACYTSNSRSKYLTYTAPDGKYFNKAKVTVAVSSGSKCGYAYSTDGSTWTYAELTDLSGTLTEKTIELTGNITHFRISRNLQDGSSVDHGVTSGTFYLSKACFEYNNACTSTTVTPSTSSVNYEMGGAWSNPTFTLAPAAVSSGTLTYSSSDEEIASVDESGNVTFNGTAGTVTITASYAGATIADVDYCASEGSYTITVSCEGGAPKIVAAGSVNMSGCNSSVTLNAKTQAGADFADGTYQWFRNGEEIDGATSSSYTATQAGTYTVERTNTSGCTTPSTNSAIVTSETTEPEVERLVPFQYYHVNKTYSDQMKMRHLFAVKNSGTLEGKHFKMYVSRNGEAATDVTSSNALVVVPNGGGHVDTVKVDLNKLSGKYSENDELVFTCKAIDCSGNVSDVYKNTITMNVIGAKPTLALICSGADGDGTRTTSKLVVGGDFLTGYNKADLCVQTGKTSWDKTQEWVLYTRLKENYIVTPVNGYAVFNKLNYEPFDILFLTDYPKASKSDAAATILDDMADLCDYRPLFTFKTHMVHKSPSKWAAKGFMAQPEVPKQSRLRLNIVCYAHPMFDDLKEVSDHIQKDASDHSQIVYTMLTGPGHENSKGMQGFPIDAAECFVTIGLVHYDATAADDSPSDGYVTWTSGSTDVMMVAAAERQVNLEARMILFSINCGAQSKLTETGRQVVLKSLEYLLSDATITPVADCSFTFTNGAGNSMSASDYASKCPACTGEKGDGKWSTAANWGPDWVLQPGKDTEVKIAAPVTVDMPHAKVRTVRILEGGSIDIPAGSGLEVGSTIRRLDGTEISPTEVVDLSIGSTSSGNGTLIFNNNAGDTKAHVGMYSKGFIDYTSNPKGDKNYQYMGVPCVDINAAYNYYGSWIYSWSDKGGSYGWKKVANGGIVTTWTGYCITQESAGTYYDISGTLAATTTVDIEVPADENMVVGNSWTAPIYIKEFADDDFENLLGNVYFFNTGVDQDYTSGHEQDLGDRYASSTYVTVPIHSSPYTGDSLISSMQGFFVKSNGSAGALHLDYDRHVRPSTNRNILSGEMHAPRRANAQSDEPAVLKIKVSGENYDDKLLLLAREDFSMGFDNGWDGDKWDGNESALYIYTKDEAGTENSVSAIPEMEGTVIGFRAGEDDAYTLHFEYLNSAEELYLFDTETNAYTKIMTGATYRFFTEDKEKHERFIITRKSPQIATDVDEVDSGKRREVRKLLIEDKMYILVNGMLYDATGKVVK